MISLKEQWKLIIAVLFFYVLIQDIALAVSVDSVHNVIPLLNQQDALTRVLKVTGFSGKDGLSFAKGTAHAELMSLDSAHISLLRESIIGNQIWLLTLNDVQVPTVYTKDNPSIKKQRDFDIWIDSYSGNILRIYSSKMDSTAREKYNPYYFQLEKGLHQNPSEIISGFPKVLPEYSLNRVFETAIDDLLKPSEIVVYYVRFSRYGSEPKPCWIIDFTGVLPFGHGGSKTDYNLNHDRKVIDAATGGMLYYLFYSAKRD